MNRGLVLYHHAWCVIAYYENNKLWISGGVRGDGSYDSKEAAFEGSLG